MPSININAKFRGKKAATIPVVDLPRNVKEALCIDTVYANGIFKIEPTGGMALYDRCYIFEDINYRNQDEDKKEDTLLQLMKWFKSMNTQFKITSANEQRDMEVYLSEIFQPLHGTEYPDIAEGIGAWMNQKIEEGTRDIRRVMYLTVTCRAKSVEEAGIYFATLDTTLQTVFSALKSRLYRMSGIERLCVLQKMLRLGEKGIAPAKESLKDDGWKNQVLPAVIEQERDYLRLNDRYAVILFAHDFEQKLDEEKVLHGLTDTIFPVYITLDIEPVPGQMLKERLSAAHANNERNISQEQTRNTKLGQITVEPSYNLKRKKRELENLMDRVDENDEDAVFLGMLLLVYADTLKELDQRADTLNQIATSNGFTLDPYYYRQLKALNTILPIGGRQVNHMRSFLTASAAAFQPFYAKDLQEKGFVYGMNQTTKHLLRGDRKTLKAPHGIIVSYTGGGKSFLIKQTELAQGLLFTDDDIIVVDPNNEQEEIIRSWGGQYFDFTPQCSIHLNGFEVPKHVWEGDATVRNMFVAKKTEYAVAFCTAVMRNIIVTQVHMTYIGRCVRLMYDAYFAQKRYDRQPTLLKLWELLKEQLEKEGLSEEKRMLLEIITSLEEYTIGVYDMFAHPSNLDIYSRLVGFGLLHIPEAVWEPVMVTMMHFLAMRIDGNQEELVAARLVVDEAQVLCEKGSSAQQLLYAIETYRKRGGIVTLAIQNLTRALENPELRDMLHNCHYKVFMDQGGVDAANLSQIQELSETEFQALAEPFPGRGIMVWDKEVYLFDARMDESNILFDRFDTNFHKKAESKKNMGHTRG